CPSAATIVHVFTWRDSDRRLFAPDVAIGGTLPMNDVHRHCRSIVSQPALPDENRFSNWWPMRRHGNAVAVGARRNPFSRKKTGFESMRPMRGLGNAVALGARRNPFSRKKTGFDVSSINAPWAYEEAVASRARHASRGAWRQTAMRPGCGDRR